MLLQFMLERLKSVILGQLCGLSGVGAEQTKHL